MFDSGVGGLTVLRALRERCPAQDFIYLGDTARLPYGTKSPETVVALLAAMRAALLERGIGCLVVACNTASASALGALRARYPALPVIGVIEPGAEAAVAASRSQHIAVIATEGTISGGAYQTAIRRRNPAARVTARACSMFVALAEEGWTAGPLPKASRTATSIRCSRPAMRRIPWCSAARISRCWPRRFARCCRRSVRIVDSAATTAHKLAARMQAAEPGARADARGRITWLATDDAQRFARVGGRFFGAELHADAVEIIDL